MSIESRTAPPTGLLIHGRDVFAPDFNRMIWGFSDIAGQLGTIPTAIVAILENVPQSVEVIYIGSGASFDPLRGGFESQVIKNILRDRFGELEDFKAIRENDQWHEPAVSHIGALAHEAITDVRAKNTAEEIENAAEYFAEVGVKKVIQVTGQDHGARATNVQAIELAKEKIPDNQSWYTLKDQQSYPTTFVSNILNASVGSATLALETPHRVDDPKFRWDPSYWPPEIMRKFMQLPENKQELVAAFMGEFLGIIGSCGPEDFEHFTNLIAPMRRMPSAEQE